MNISEFRKEQVELQLKWRNTQNISTEFGMQNKKQYSHIIPKKEWSKTVWSPIRDDLLKYLKEQRIQHHTGTHNLLSSWVLCSNLYFICRTNSSFRQLLSDFLSKKLSIKIDTILNVELEYALTGKLSPCELLGEDDGIRGSGQTSPDVAIVFENANTKGLILTECKYTEHSFYACSGRKKKHNSGKIPNPDPERCLTINIVNNFKQGCHQYVWGRKYWDYLKIVDNGKEFLKCCPASKAGYQLIRQQALAEGIAMNGDFSPVFSAVAYDDRNTVLKKSMRTSGILNVFDDFGKLFSGKSLFSSWTHQEWVDYVRKNCRNDIQKQWLSYINDRYGT
jgi:hypothetical protein